MDELSGFLDVVALFYDSVLDNEKWQRACESLADYVGGTGVGFVVANPQAGSISHCETFRIDEHFREKYLNYYATREVRLPPAVNFDVGVVLNEQMLLEKKELERSEIYGDLLLPSDVPHFMFAWIKKSPTSCETLAVENSMRGGAFGANAMERYRRLLPHIHRAIRMRAHLSAARLTAESCLSVLDSMPYGVVFLDARAKVLSATSAAIGIFERSDGLGVFQNTVRAVDREDDRRLQRAIDRAVKFQTDVSASGSTLKISRAVPTKLLVYVIALKAREHLQFARSPSAMLLIVDPDAYPTADWQRIQRALNLTQAEAVLAAKLFHGQGLTEAADSLNISINTAKTQLKSIYLKTNVRNHVELARKIMNIAHAPTWLATTIF